jgi:hypothetical protein
VLRGHDYRSPQTWGGGGIMISKEGAKKTEERTCFITTMSAVYLI